MNEVSTRLGQVAAKPRIKSTTSLNDFAGSQHDADLLPGINPQLS
jgi:hypothetical protein